MVEVLGFVLVVFWFALEILGVGVVRLGVRA
jgi:hypothetical protein